MLTKGKRNENIFLFQVLDMLSAAGSGLSSYLPVLDHISFLMDLMEVALNIQGLLDLCTQVCSASFTLKWWKN